MAERNTNERHDLWCLEIGVGPGAGEALGPNENMASDANVEAQGDGRLS